MSDFKAWGKTARLFRDIVITEKIDGTNAQIVITPYGEQRGNDIPEEGINVGTEQGLFNIKAGSRTRFVHPYDDNFGFARWVWENAHDLVKLGEGRHYGEWWGQGIQRKYGMDQKVFSLFNTKKWIKGETLPELQGLDVVPVLYEGAFSETDIREVTELLNAWGSQAAKRYGVTFDRPEGVCIYHAHSGTIFKYTPYEKEDGHKG